MIKNVKLPFPFAPSWVRVVRSDTHLVIPFPTGRGWEFYVWIWAKLKYLKEKASGRVNPHVLIVVNDAGEFPGRGFIHFIISVSKKTVIFQSL